MGKTTDLMVDTCAGVGLLNFSTADYRKVARKLLLDNTVEGPRSAWRYCRQPSPETLPSSESEMLEVWMRSWEQACAV